MPDISDPTILYDLTWLIRRHVEPTMTGIDVVDLRLARHTQEKAGPRCVFVCQLGDRLCLVPRDLGNRLLDELDRRWLGGRPADPSLGPALAAARLLPPAVRAAVGPTDDRDAEPPRGGPRAGGQGPPQVSRDLLPEGNGAVVYVNNAHVGLNRDKLFADLAGIGARALVYIYDTIPVDFPEYVKVPRGTDIHRDRLLNTARSGARILCCSEDTRKAITAVLAREGAPHADIRVCTIGSDSFPMSSTEPLDGMPETYFMMIGTITGRKNHLGMLQIWRDMIARADDPPKLFIVGRRGWQAEAVFALLDRSEGLRRHVVEANGVETPRMTRMLAGARALLFPSFAEGWGMPLVEALSLGVPVICSDIPVFREAGAGVPEYLSPIDLAAWRRAILDFARPDSPLRAAQLQRIATFRPPVWSDTFRVYDEAIAVSAADA